MARNSKKTQTNIPPSNKKKKMHIRKKKKSGRRTLHHVLLIAAVLIIGIVLSLTVFFKIEDVIVFGIDQYDNEEIKSAANIELGSNLFLTDISEIPETLKSRFPYMEEVTVKRVLPPAIEIHVTPSIPVAALQQGEEYALITANGKILERGLVLLPADVILVKGLDLKDYQPGYTFGSYSPVIPSKDATKEEIETIKASNLKLEEIAEQENNNIAIILYVIDAMKKTDFQGISNLDLSDPYNMTIVYENRLILRLGTELNLEYKFRHIKETIASLEPDAHGILRAENASKSARIVFSPSEEYEKKVEEKDEKESEKEKENLLSPTDNPA